MRRARIYCRQPETVEGMERPPPRVRLRLVNFKLSDEKTAQLKRLAYLKGYQNFSLFMRDTLDGVLLAEATFLAECPPNECPGRVKPQ